jgi:peptide/nickel transport system permease protein
VTVTAPTTSNTSATLGAATPGRARASAALRLAGRLLRDPVVCIAAAFLLVVVLCAIFAPLIAPYEPNEINAFSTLQAPSATHLLGTDENGRDVLSRVIYGSRVSLTVGVISVGIAVLVGVPLGLIAGYTGRAADSVIMRLMDAVLAFPSLILALAIVAILGQGINQVMIAIGITSIPVFARLVRAQTLSLKMLDFTIAARAMGAPSHRVLGRHILPNTLAPVIVQASLGMAFAILAEAGLSFLGVGIKPPTATWGGMLQKALRVIHQAPWLSIFPGVAIFLTVLALNLVGDALRDVLDPRLRGRLQDGR